MGGLVKPLAYVAVVSCGVMAYNLLVEVRPRPALPAMAMQASSAPAAPLLLAHATYHDHATLPRLSTRTAWQHMRGGSSPHPSLAPPAGRQAAAVAHSQCGSQRALRPHLLCPLPAPRLPVSGQAAAGRDRLTAPLWLLLLMSLPGMAWGATSDEPGSSPAHWALQSHGLPSLRRLPTPPTPRLPPLMQHQRQLRPV